MVRDNCTLEIGVLKNHQDKLDSTQLLIQERTAMQQNYSSGQLRTGVLPLGIHAAYDYGHGWHTNSSHNKTV